MSGLKTYRVFISHAWTYNEDYYRLEGTLDKAPYLNWQNYSVPEHDTLAPALDTELEKALRRQISPTNIVIILSGMYAAYHKWIQKKIDIAIEMSKPIIGIKPWGQERIPQTVQDVGNEIVGWNTSSIVSTFRRHAL